ncbi:MAG: ornithine cyclodeaminase [Acidobacteria bacterium 13_1_40CM_65_14]|nr:MAG: ornithine cyclodeaminase [Acidobacteria bacterium 13_1_40CM_65_14]OLC84455.1 MAG: ornithine cyclodeaminase [Acidobacteria bacterium 13_1_40CM_4_65_8]OLE83820.1 MAG: ornithine cyclodeaminase [Acidobacteria bacterium 13_1_20CM_2_65_9]
MSDEPIWISESDVTALIDMPAAIRALEAGLLAEARGTASNMTKTHVEFEANGGHATLHAIGAAFTEAGIAGTKTWAHTPGGATPLLILFDANTGRLLAIVEAFALGQLRTGAASGVATKWLAAEDARELALIGTGKQSIPQVAAVAAVRSLKRVRVFGRDAERRRRVAARICEELGIQTVEATSVADAVNGAPIVTTVTRAREPFLTGTIVARGAHVNAVGAITPGGAEIASDLLARCTRVVVDSPPQARRLSRELIDFYGTDDERWKSVRPLSEVAAERQRRTPGDDLTLFKSLGMGISDLSLGIEIYNSAKAAGLGMALTHSTGVAPRLSASGHTEPRT